MSQSKISELEDYVRRVGEHINKIYLRIDAIDKKVEEIEEQITVVRANMANSTQMISDLKENTVHNAEFDEFVDRLTESLREFLPPSTEVEQAQAETEEE